MRDNGTEEGDIAAIFCDISACTSKINQLHGSKVIQTQELKAQREELWQMVRDLKTKADGYDTDYQIQVWIEIDALIDGNISDFLEVATPDELTALLIELDQAAVNLEGSNPDIVNLIDQLHASISETLLKVETANG